jgi:hypothetical protein
MFLRGGASTNAQGNCVQKLCTPVPPPRPPPPTYAHIRFRTDRHIHTHPGSLPSGSVPTSQAAHHVPTFFSSKCVPACDQYTAALWCVASHTKPFERTTLDSGDDDVDDDTVPPSTPSPPLAPASLACCCRRSRRSCCASTAATTQPPSPLPPVAAAAAVAPAASAVSAASAEDEVASAVAAGVTLPLANDDTSLAAIARVSTTLTGSCFTKAASFCGWNARRLASGANRAAAEAEAEVEAAATKTRVSDRHTAATCYTQAEHTAHAQTKLSMPYF